MLYQSNSQRFISKCYDPGHECTSFTPHNTPIWTSRYILVRRRSVLEKDCFTKGLCSVVVWWIQKDIFKPWKLLCPVSFTKLFKNVEMFSGWSGSVVKESVVYSNTAAALPSSQTEGLNAEDFPPQRKSPKPVLRVDIVTDFTKEQMIKIRTHFTADPLPPKAEEMQFKMMN